MYGGKVEAVYDDKELGRTIVISSGKYEVYYGALASVSVTTGETMSAGAKIGTVGSSSAEPFPHLHLAVKSGGKYVNPREVLSEAR